MNDEVSWSQPPTADQSQPPALIPDGPTGGTQRHFSATVKECLHCGGEVDFDGYCQQCGAKAPKLRDHLELAALDWLAGVCDRGMRHANNEDALALAGLSDKAVIVVCDGVSTSTDSAPAALAAAQQATEYLISQDSITADELVAVMQIANQAVIDNSDLAGSNPASCTIAIGVLQDNELISATLGDSRVYWLPDNGEPQLLSVDHSIAQEEISAGIDRSSAEMGLHSHVITRWLGRDAPDLTPQLNLRPTDGAAGWFMVCSDGLWNYVSDPHLMKALVDGLVANGADSPIELARQLVAWANNQGGHDNITVGLARLTATDPANSESVAVEYETPTSRIRPQAE